MTSCLQKCALLLVNLHLMVIMSGPLTVEASCGSVSCFVVIGSQQQISPKGLLTVNLFFNYTPSEAPPGQGGGIPFANQELKTLTLANIDVQQIRTLVRTATLDLNYGLTERLGLEVALPYKMVNADANLGQVSSVPYSDKGLGDTLVKLKYNVLPTLRSMLVFDFGVSIPTGDYQQRATTGNYAESTLQLGKGAVGLIPSFYQTYEIIPHRLNQYLQGSYRHTFRNPDGYQFGDEWSLNGGFNVIPFQATSWLVLIQQMNYRYTVHDSMEASLFVFAPAPINRPILLDSRITNRPVPTTGSTFLAYSPGIMLNLWDFAQAYFIAQIPVARDFNGNLEQGQSYVFGFTKSFQVFSGS
ncbi:conserved exported protein of unknown function [Nitrospira sp. KM1]|uniref:transporter n=1 Tax=Nitrospira sp. KM1 TaxID=1936990 RepID=UPI0013A79D20|nr:transporter [Nitrospira sp. KM1]BCA53357.1 conserved exported protein of unknown function [Nitrospira sp. KM1]